MLFQDFRYETFHFLDYNKAQLFSFVDRVIVQTAYHFAAEVDIAEDLSK